MRRVIPNILTAAAIALCAVSVALWIWSLSDSSFLLSDFFYGRFDGQRAWRGYYLVVFRGQIAFELEQITYASQPTSAPTNRWSAEDAVWISTPALRSFPFDGPLGFHYMQHTVSDAGTLRTTRLAFPLWLVLVVLLLPLLYRYRSLLRRPRGAHPRTIPHLPPHPSESSDT